MSAMKSPTRKATGALALSVVAFVLAGNAGQAQDVRRDRGLTRSEAIAISRSGALRDNRSRVRTDQPFESPFGVGGRSRPLPPSGSGSTVVPNR